MCINFLASFFLQYRNIIQGCLKSHESIIRRAIEYWLLKSCIIFVDWVMFFLFYNILFYFYIVVPKLIVIKPALSLTVPPKKSAVKNQFKVKVKSKVSKKHIFSYHKHSLKYCGLFYFLNLLAFPPMSS